MERLVQLQPADVRSAIALAAVVALLASVAAASVGMTMLAAA